MKTLAVCGIVLLLTGGAFAQRINNSRGTNSGFGSVVFPAGRPTTGQPFTQTPNFANVTGNVIAGRPPFTGVRTDNRFNRGGAVIYVPYAYPVAGYGYGFGSGYGYGYGEAPPPQQQPANVTVIYPPQQPTPVIVMGNPGAPPPDVPRSSIQDYNPPPAPPADTTAASPDTTYYLLAFKDHSVYSAVGYWVDSDTLHYLTGNNIHNQVSLSLVDRDLTAQLNKGRGVTVNLPAAK